MIKVNNRGTVKIDGDFVDLMTQFSELVFALKSMLDYEDREYFEELLGILVDCPNEDAFLELICNYEEEEL